ncbi:hypothetical protein GGR56DRAFT_639114 [Xylariaceae sp. FL0804]|nr:hypothetical protein GGR56DRAFT_639114 [Xylariaceae sp. FL0804]
MTPTLDNALLRNSLPWDQADYLRERLQHVPWATVSAHLYHHIESGALPAPLIHVFLAVCKEPDAVVEALNQDVSVLARQLAIKRFAKCLRSDARLTAMWSAAGGTGGLLELMAKMSVDHVTYLCLAIGRTAWSQSAVEERQQRVTELFRALCNTSGDDQTVPKNPDPRPLRAAYDSLVPACNSEIVVNCTSANRQPKAKVYRAHRQAFQEKCIAEAFPSQGKGKRLSAYDVLIGRGLEFPLGVLERLAENRDHLATNADLVVRHLACPLARRLRNRRASDAVQIRLYGLVIRCCELEPKASTHVTRSIVGPAVQAWKRAREGRDVLKGMLATLVSYWSSAWPVSVKDFNPLVRSVGPGLRFALLRLLFRNARQYKVDLDLFSDAANERLRDLKVTWPCELFYSLPSGISVRLFEYLKKTYTDGNFLARLDTWASLRLMGNGMGDGMIDSTYNGDPELLSAILHSRHAEVQGGDLSWMENTTIKRSLADRQRRAMIARDADARAQWAQAAILLAAASGSLKLYGETRLWARRFNRDVQTAEMLYNSHTILNVETVDLLCAIPRLGVRDASRLAAIRQDVLDANQIIDDLLETMSMCRKEPGLNWKKILRALLRLPSLVVSRRVERVDSMDQRISLSDADLDEAVWTPTVDMMVRFERFCFRAEHVLFNRRAGGCLENEHFSVSPGRRGRQFLDKLCKARDELWREERLASHPAAATIEDPYPRGCPLQLLCPRGCYKRQGEVVFAEKNAADMPYLQSRAEAVVFASGQSLLRPALAADKETWTAIGEYVDDYCYALRVYVNSAGGSEAQNRALRAWQHARTAFRGDQVTLREAKWFWKHNFDAIPDVTLPDSADPDFSLKHPSLPLSDTAPAPPSQLPVEWNPDPVDELIEEKAQKAQSEALRGTHLGFMLGTQGDMVGRGTPEAHFSSKSLWGRYVSPTKQLLPRAQDALTAAIISYLNARCGSDPSLLMQPFPSKDPRFPALFLDQDFLERESARSSSVDSALVALGHLSAAVPIQLLEALARSLLGRLERDDKDQTPEATVMIIRRLARGDRPVVACEFIRHMLLSRQDDSSWHRHLVNRGFLNRLPARAAKEFLQDLSSAIQEKLEQQEQRLQESRSDQSHSADPIAGSAETVQTAAEARDDGVDGVDGVVGGSPTPAVKVTTVKIIPQLLRHTSYLDQAASVQILVELLKRASHHDIRVAIVQSLLYIISDTSEETLRSDIIDVIHKNVVPIAAALNERRPLSEAGWVEAEQGSGLPEIYEDAGPDELPPIMQLLIEAGPRISKKVSGPKEKAKNNWVQRIVVPLLDASASNHRRWHSLFLSRNNFSLRAEDLTSVPLRPHILADLLHDYPQCFDSSTLQTIKRHVEIVINPTQSLEAVNNAVARSPDLAQSRAGQHWLSVWSKANVTAASLGVEKVTDLLLNPQVGASSEENPSGGCLTVPEIHRFTFDILDTLLEQELGQCEDFLLKVSQTTSVVTTRERHELWRRNYLPLLEGLIRHIDAQRTDDWQRDPKRHPPHLPRTDPMRLCAMELRHWGPAAAASSTADADAEDFAAAVTALLRDLTDRPEGYHVQWPAAKTRIARMPFSTSTAAAAPAQRSLRAALALGGVLGPGSGWGSGSTAVVCLPPGPGLVDHLRVEIAADVLTTMATRGDFSGRRRNGEGDDKGDGEGDDRDDLEEVLRAVRAMLEQWRGCTSESIRARGDAVLEELRDSTSTHAGLAWRDAFLE